MANGCDRTIKSFYNKQKTKTMVVKSVFQIKGEHYTVVGYGQEATSAIMKQFPLKRIIFMGFMMGEDFQPF